MTVPSNLVDGQWCDPERRKNVLNPADGSVVGSIGYGDAELAHAAVGAAQRSAWEWAGMTGRARGGILRSAADLIDERAAELGRVLAAESGKRLPEGIGELRASAEYFRWFAEECRRPRGQVFEQEAPGRRHLTISQPAGPVASLTPWNFPCSIQARKLAPALAAGCTVVARVSDKAPLAVTGMIRCLTDAGIPAGVLNLVHGPAAEITDTFLSHEEVRVVTFTGSTEVGRRILEQAGAHIVRPLLELGGDAAFIVFEDADIDAAVEGAMLAKFRNNGQSCIGANRFLVHRDVYEAFTSRLGAKVASMTVGPGAVEPVPDLGPCIDSDRVSAVTALVEEALVRGAKLLHEPVAIPDEGDYCAPALLENVAEDCGLLKEEVFGPAAAVVAFDTEDEAISVANDTKMGLAGYVYSESQSRLWRRAEALEVGVLGFNEPLPTVCFAPMGGVKRSGLGREGSSVGLEEFEETRYVSVAIPQPS